MEADVDSLKPEYQTLAKCGVNLDYVAKILIPVLDSLNHGQSTPIEYHLDKEGLRLTNTFGMKLGAPLRPPYDKDTQIRQHHLSVWLWLHSPGQRSLWAHPPVPLWRRQTDTPRPFSLQYDGNCGGAVCLGYWHIPCLRDSTASFPQPRLIRYTLCAHFHLYSSR
jgi:hypothetical protein